VTHFLPQTRRAVISPSLKLLRVYSASIPLNSRVSCIVDSCTFYPISSMQLLDSNCSVAFLPSLVSTFFPGLYPSLYWSLLSAFIYKDRLSQVCCYLAGPAEELTEYSNSSAWGQTGSPAQVKVWQIRKCAVVFNF
jgi:hypothetical protein